LGLLETLTATSSAEIRVEEVARGRRHAADRAYDDGAVVEAIAGELLVLSASTG
jgi:hypothetical protein